MKLLMLINVVKNDDLHNLCQLIEIKTRKQSLINDTCLGLLSGKRGEKQSHLLS